MGVSGAKSKAHCAGLMGEPAQYAIAPYHGGHCPHQVEREKITPQCPPEK
jgi:hypothetical protein